MTSSNGSIFRVTVPLCGEFTGHRWIPLKKASDAELWCFLWSAPWIKGWVSNREVAGLRRLRAHYDVIAMPVQKNITWHICRKSIFPYSSVSHYWHWDYYTTVGTKQWSCNETYDLIYHASTRIDYITAVNRRATKICTWYGISIA